MLYLLILALAGKLLLQHGKVQIHEMINAHVTNNWVGVFFKYITHLGDGLLAVIIAIVLLFISVRKSLYILLSYAAAGIVSSIMKHYIYPDVSRPHFTFQYFVRRELNEIDGVDLLASNTFPSGHALSAFALFFCLLFMTKNHFLKFTFFVLAILAAFSRVYISQHWLIDIYVGSIIGTSFALLFYFVFYQNKMTQRLDQPIQNLFSKNKTNV